LSLYTAADSRPSEAVSLVIKKNDGNLSLRFLINGDDVFTFEYPMLPRLGQTIFKKESLASVTVASSVYLSY